MSKLDEAAVLSRAQKRSLGEVRRLNCWGVGVSDVSVLERAPHLEVLCVSANRIGSLSSLARCRRLTHLYIRQNEILCLGELQHLSELEYLQVLWLEGNPCAPAGADYRDQVLAVLPRLRKLDNVPVEKYPIFRTFPDISAAKSMSGGCHESLIQGGCSNQDGLLVLEEFSDQEGCVNTELCPGGGCPVEKSSLTTMASPIQLDEASVVEAAAETLVQTAIVSGKSKLAIEKQWQEIDSKRLSIDFNDNTLGSEDFNSCGIDMTEISHDENYCGGEQKIGRKPDEPEQSLNRICDHEVPENVLDSTNIFCVTPPADDSRKDRAEVNSSVAEPQSQNPTEAATSQTSNESTIMAEAGKQIPKTSHTESCLTDKRAYRTSNATCSTADSADESQSSTVEHGTSRCGDPELADKCPTSLCASGRCLADVGPVVQASVTDAIFSLMRTLDGTSLQRVIEQAQMQLNERTADPHGLSMRLSPTLNNSRLDGL